MDAAATSVLVVTGAGVSISAGLAAYRTEGGVWADENFERMSHARHYGNYLTQLKPKWRTLASSMEAVTPTSFHTLVAERGWRVITQNVDGLHQKAGSQEVLEVHGTMSTWRCLRCKASFPFSSAFPTPKATGQCPTCSSSKVRPDVVLFGEQLKDHKKARRWVWEATTILYAGTSGQVEPVASWYKKAPTSLLVDPHPWGSFTHSFPMGTDEWAAAGGPLLPLS